MDIWQWFRCLPAENRFSNDGEVGQLFLDCYDAYNEHRFPRLIELCGTSDALQALVAARDEDNLPLYVLCVRQSGNKVLARIKQLRAQAAVDEMFFLDEGERTALALATAYEAPFAVLESMILLGKLDVKKRNILDIANLYLRLPLPPHCPLPLRSRRHQAPGSSLPLSPAHQRHYRSHSPGPHRPSQQEPRRRAPRVFAHRGSPCHNRPPHHAPPLHQARFRLQEQAPPHGDHRARHPARF